jgi:hypothetical protein
VAYPGEGNAIEVALSSKPFDRKEFAKDGKLDSFDIMHHRMDTDSNVITLKIEGDGSMNCMDFLLEGGGGSSCGSSQGRSEDCQALRRRRRQLRCRKARQHPCASICRSPAR